MRLAVFDPHFREDLTHWVEKDRKVALRVLRLVEAVLQDIAGGMTAGAVVAQQALHALVLLGLAR